MLNEVKSAFGGSKKFWAVFAAAVLLIAAAIPALALTEGSVTATVTPGVISVSVSPGSVAYGTVGVPTVDNIPTGDTVITANNDGGIPETFNIKGDNATGTTLLWNIVDGAPGGTASYNYNHKFVFCTDNALACTTVAAANNMTTGYEVLATNVHPTTGDSRYFKLRLSTPTETGGDTSVHSTTVTVQAVAF